MHKLYACLGSGNCFKPWLAMQQLGIPHDLHLIDVLQGEQKSEEYLAINPLGVVPYLQTDAGVGIGESGAMLWHLCEGSHLMPTTADDRAKALQWMFFEQSKLEPFISPARFFTTILPHMADARADDIGKWQEQAGPGLALLNTHLADHRFMLGDTYTLTDIAVFGYTHVVEEAGLSLGNLPHIARWIDAVAQTEGFQTLSTLGAAPTRAVA